MIAGELLWLALDGALVTLVSVAIVVEAVRGAVTRHRYLPGLGVVLLAALLSLGNSLLHGPHRPASFSPGGVAAVAVAAAGVLMVVRERRRREPGRGPDPRRPGS